MSDRFAHALNVARIRDGERLELVADDAERSAIADRLGLGSIARLEAQTGLSREGGLVRAKGRLTASLEQSCVVTGEPYPPMSTRPSTLSSCPSRSRPPPTTRSSSAKAIATRSSTMVGRSISAARSPTRWRSASTPIRAARTPTRRSRKRAFSTKGRQDRSPRSPSSRSGSTDP